MEGERKEKRKGEWRGKDRNCCTQAYHFATDENGFTKCTDVLLHQCSLPSTVWRSEQALDFHPGELVRLVSKQLAGHLIGYQDPGLLGIYGDDGFVRVASSCGEERELLPTSCSARAARSHPAHWGRGLYVGNREGTVQALCESLHEGSACIQTMDAESRYM